MKEIGSFIELELRNTGEYYQGEMNIARLNTGRGGIYHALKLMKLTSVHIPYYLCPTVRDFLKNKRVKITPYLITEGFEPVLAANDKNSAVLIVNYFGILGKEKILKIRGNYKNVILDNSPAFFSQPVEECYNVYSTRKFFGVPDGSYVIGAEADRLVKEYRRDESSDTSAFLLKRIEKGSSHTYPERMENENRLDRSDVMTMSVLTRRILQSIDYEIVKEKRKINFHTAHQLFRSINKLNPTIYMDEHAVPMVYPLVIEDAQLMEKLKKNQIYTGRWWNSVLKEVEKNTFEAWLSKYMLPIPIDQRYDKKELQHIKEIIKIFK